MIRSPYRTYMRIGTGPDSQVIRIRWFFTDRKPLGTHTAYGSLNWRGRPKLDLGQPGEVPGSLFQWVTGKKPPDLLPGGPFGDAKAWAGLSTADSPKISLPGWNEQRIRVFHKTFARLTNAQVSGLPTGIGASVRFDIGGGEGLPVSCVWGIPLSLETGLGVVIGTAQNVAMVVQTSTGVPIGTGFGFQWSTATHYATGCTVGWAVSVPLALATQDAITESVGTQFDVSLDTTTVEGITAAPMTGFLIRMGLPVITNTAVEPQTGFDVSFSITTQNGPVIRTQSGFKVKLQPT